MSENVITVSELFSLPDAPVPDAEPPKDWQDRLGARLDEELKGIKWPTALPDVTAKLAQLLDLPLPTLFFDAWKKSAELQTAMRETSAHRDESRSIRFGEHTIETTWEPSIEVRLWKVVPLPKRLRFPVTIEASFQSVELEVRNGAVSRIECGACDIQGTLSLGDTPIAQRNFGTIKLCGPLQDEESPKES